MMKKIISDREKKILRLRFAIDRPKKAQTTAKETLETVGLEVGVSHNRVKVIESQALEKLGSLCRMCITTEPGPGDH